MYNYVLNYLLSLELPFKICLILFQISMHFSLTKIKKNFTNSALKWGKIIHFLKRIYGGTRELKITR